MGNTTCLVLSCYLMEKSIYVQESCHQKVLGISLWRNTESITVHHPPFFFYLIHICLVPKRFYG